MQACELLAKAKKPYRCFVSPCNQLLGHLRDDVEALRRAVVVIRDRPAQAVINSLN